MRNLRRVLAVGVLALASLFVPWTAIAAPQPHVDGVAAAEDAGGTGRILLVIGKHLSSIRTFELRNALNETVGTLPVIHRSRSLALLGLPADLPPGGYTLIYASRGNHSGAAVVRLVGPAPPPDPCPVEPPSCPDPPPPAPPGPYLRLAGGDTVTGTIEVSTSGRALSAASAWTGRNAGAIDSTASGGTAVAGHGDVGVLGDVDSDGDYGVWGRTSASNQAGVAGTTYSSGSTGVLGDSIYAGVGVHGRSYVGIGVYGVVGGCEPDTYSYCSVYPCGADIGVKAVSKCAFSTALSAEAQGSQSTGLLVNHSGGSGDLAVFQADGTNCARIALDGTGYFNGGTYNSGADFAESVAVNSPAKDFEPGDVVAIDPASPRRFSLCRTPNSALVAGVVSTRPAVVGTVHDMATVGRAALEDEVRVGIVGIVPTKVCDEGGPVRIGDLLVSASRAGHAMRAPAHPAPGTIIGKALGALAEGTGKVEVLLTAR